MGWPGSRLRTSKSFFCFKPLFEDNDPAGAGAHDDPVLAYFSVANKSDAVLPKILSAVPGGGEAAGDVHEKKGPLWRLSRIVKAVLLETSLVAKKLRNKNFQHNSNRPNSSRSSSYLDLNSINEKPIQRGEDSSESDVPGLNSRVSSSSRLSSALTNPTSLCDSSSASTVSSLSKKTSESNLTQYKQGSLHGQVGGTIVLSRYGSNTALALLLTSLLVLIFWGKLCAILCTSTCLILLRRRCCEPELPEVAPEVDSAEYKKRVIMEGLLERNRNRI